MPLFLTQHLMISHCRWKPAIWEDLYHRNNKTLQVGTWFIILLIVKKVMEKTLML